jgi:hypothetical protein
MRRDLRLNSERGSRAVEALDECAIREHEQRVQVDVRRYLGVHRIVGANVGGHDQEWPRWRIAKRFGGDRAGDEREPRRNRGKPSTDHAGTSRM